MCENCIRFSIPEYLCTAEKPTIEVPLPDKIYRRLKKEHYNATTGEVGLGAFDLRDDSYNLHSLSKVPEDVLYNTKTGEHFNELGILVIDVSSIRSADHPYEASGKVSHCSLDVFHKPEECMYPHSEVWTYIDGAYKNPLNSSHVKKAMRHILLNAAKVIKVPGSHKVIDPDTESESE